MEELTVSYKGKRTMLNIHMLIQQGIAGDDEKIEDLLVQHFMRLILVDNMRMCDIKDMKTLSSLALDIGRVDYKLQEIWGFMKDARYHRFWELPHCICPNGEDRLGSSGWIINTACPVHGTV